MLLQAESDSTLTADRLRAQLLTDWPDLDSELLTVGDPDPETEDDDGPITLDYAEFLIALMPIAAVAGDDTAEIAERSRLWPQERTLEYRAHTIVTVIRIGEREDPDPLAECVLLSQVVASAVTLGGSVEAVYWSAAGHVILPQLFVELAHEILPDPIPLAWVAINVWTQPTGELAGATQGMRMLGLVDIEIPQTSEDAPQIFNRLTNLVGYLIDNGPVIGDGDTVGHSAEEKIEVVHTTSSFDDEQTVLQLRYTAAQRATARWWHRK